MPTTVSLHLSKIRTTVIPTSVYVNDDQCFTYTHRGKTVILKGASPI